MFYDAFTSFNNYIFELIFILQTLLQMDYDVALKQRVTLQRFVDTNYEK